MSKRIKVNGPVIQTRAQAESILGEIRDLTIERAQQMATREAQLKEVEDEHKDSLAALGKRIQEASELLRGWAEANPSEFHGAKSVVLTHGTVGWRTGNPTLKPVSGFTWDRVLEKIRGLVPYRRFIRTKEEVDKAGILAERETLQPEDLRMMGVKVIQEEAFFVDPKIEETETRQSLPAEGAR